MVATPEEQISIRDAVCTDAASIAKLGAYIFKSSFGHSVEPEEMAKYLREAYSVEAITQDITNPDKDTIVAVNPQGDVVGFALLTKGTIEPCLRHIESQIELQRLYVDPSLHGKGMGTTLASAMEEKARKQKFKHIWLGCWEENLKAQKLYTRLGYKIVGDHDFAMGRTVQKDYIMLKEL